MSKSLSIMLARIALCLYVIPFSHGDFAGVVSTNILNKPSICHKISLLNSLLLWFKISFGALKGVVHILNIAAIISSFCFDLTVVVALQWMAWSIKCKSLWLCTSFKFINITSSLYAFKVSYVLLTGIK